MHNDYCVVSDFHHHVFGHFNRLWRPAYLCINQVLDFRVWDDA